MAHAYVGGASNATSSSVTSVSATYAPTAGNGLLVTVYYQQSSSRAFSDIQNQSGTSLNPVLLYTGGLEDASNYSGFYVAFCPNVPSGITAVKGVLGSASSAGIGIDVREYSGLTTIGSQAVGNAVQNTFTTTANAITASATPNAQPGLIFAVATNVSAGASPPSVGTGFTSRGTPSFALAFGTVQFRIEDGSYSSLSSTAATMTNAGASGNEIQMIMGLIPDAAPPATLSSPALASYADVSATGTVTSDTAGGTLYGAITNTSATPTAAQIKAGGGNVVSHTSITAASGSNSVTITGLTASTTYYGPWFVENNGSDSNIVGLATSFTTNPPSPAISSLSSSSPTEGSTLTITLTNGGASQGTVTIGGVNQTVTSWSATSIQVTVVLGSNKYGSALNLIVTSSLGYSSTPYSVSGGILPASGWSYINMTTPNATTTARLTSVSVDLASADQIHYENKSNLVTVAADGTIAVDSSVTSWQARAWTATYGWGAYSTQTML
jgi:hypothetical protein